MDKPVYFMHIPKTAGTSVNSFMGQLLGLKPKEMLIRFDTMKDWRKPGFLDGYRFVSGHSRYAYASKYHDLSRFFTFTLIREPYSQLASFFNWHRTLSDPDHEYYRFLDLAFMAVGARLRAMDFESLDEWQRFVDNLDPFSRNSFDNFQTRFFVETDAGYESINEEQSQLAIERLANFDFVATTENLQESLALLSAQLGFDQIPSVPCENQSPINETPNFESPELRELLKPLVKHDLELYKSAQEHMKRMKLMQ